MFDYILVFCAPPPPPPAHKINNNILIYLLLTGYCNWRPPPPLPVIKIVKYCDVWGGWGGIGGRQNPAKNNGAPFLIKKVKYCGVVGVGTLVALKFYKHNGAPSLSLRLLSIVVSGEGGALGGGAPKSYKK